MHASTMAGAVLLLLMSSVVTAADNAGPDRVCAVGVSKEASEPCDGLAGPKEAGGSGANLSVEAAADKTTGSVSVARTWVSWGEDATRTIALNLTAKAPFDSGKDDIRDIGSLSELTAGSSVGLDIKMFFWPMTDAPTHMEREAVCIEYVRQAVPGYVWLGPEDGPIAADDIERQATILNAPELGLTCYALLVSDKALEQAVSQRNELHLKQKKAAEAAGKPFPPSVKEARVARDVAPALRKKALPELYRKQAEGFPVAHGFRVSTTANRQGFDYVDPSAPTVKKSVSHNGIGLSLAYEAVMGRAVARVGAGRERSYKGADKQQVCSPLESTGSFTCLDAALEPPKRNDETVYFAEYRSYIPGSTTIAIAPRLEFNSGKDEYGFQLPVYLTADPKRVLDMGVMLGWTSEEDFSFGIFFGKSFSFFD